MKLLHQWLIAAGFCGLLIFGGGCKKSDPPPPETDPDKLKQIEEQVEKEGQREGAAKANQ